MAQYTLYCPPRSKIDDLPSIPKYKPEICTKRLSPTHEFTYEESTEGYKATLHHLASVAAFLNLFIPGEPLK